MTYLIKATQVADNGTTGEVAGVLVGEVTIELFGQNFRRDARNTFLNVSKLVIAIPIETTFSKFHFLFVTFQKS